MYCHDYIQVFPDRGVRFVVSEGETIEVKPTERTVADER